MRTINKIIIHSTATPEGKEVSVKDITAWHKERGWKTIGYHYVVDLKGITYKGRPIEMIGAHCSGENTKSIGVAYVGGTDENKRAKDTRNEFQRRALIKLIKELKKTYGNIPVYGHKNFSTTECPSFNAKEEYKNI